MYTFISFTVTTNVFTQIVATGGATIGILVSYVGLRTRTTAADK